jgi:hypothetical protein
MNETSHYSYLFYNLNCLTICFNSALAQQYNSFAFMAEWQSTRIGQVQNTIGKSVVCRSHRFAPIPQIYNQIANDTNPKQPHRKSTWYPLSFNPKSRTRDLNPSLSKKATPTQHATSRPACSAVIQMGFAGALPRRDSCSRWRPPPPPRRHRSRCQGKP